MIGGGVRRRQVFFLVQRVLVTTDLPSWDLQLRSDPPSYALGATTNYKYLHLLLLSRTAFQPLSLYSASSICGSGLFLSTMRCPSCICAPCNPARTQYRKATLTTHGCAGLTSIVVPLRRDALAQMSHLHHGSNGSLQLTAGLASQHKGCR